MPLQRSFSLFILGIIVTVPIIFGAVHPIVQGVYVFLMLVGCGGWLLLTVRPKELGFPSFWLLVPLVLIAYLVFQSLPFPLELIEILSPERADRIAMVNEMARTTVTSTTISDSGITGLYRSFFILGLLFYFFSLIRLCDNDPKFFKLLILILAAVGTFEAVYGILQFLKPQLGILWLPLTGGRAAHGTIIYKNQFASMLNMLWPLTVTAGGLYMLAQQRRPKPGAPIFTTTKPQAMLLLFGAGFMIVAVLFSLSRGGILSMSAVALLLLLLLPYSLKGKVKFLALFILAVFGYVMLLGVDTIITRFDSISTSGTNRFSVYLNSIPMFADHWLTGIGLGSYGQLSPIYLKGFPENIHFYRAHNEYLELFIELGAVFGGLLFCWIGFGMAKLFFNLKTTMKKQSATISLIAIATAAFCGIIGFLLHGIVDFGWRLPVNHIYAVTLLAILITGLKTAAVKDTGVQSNGGM